MERSTLYLVPTPIGNLRDITLRALDIMQGVDLIVCEDTRHTKKLLTHYGISRPLLSCERFSESKRIDLILKQLESGKNIALVSDAGTPAVSDPGSKLVSMARAKGIRVEALPGPCAFLTALSGSGFEPPFRFIGFFPRQKNARDKELMRMSISSDATIFYESPKRLVSTLGFIMELMPDRELCVARELTKIHEEYLTGIPKGLIDRLGTGAIKGEVTVIIKGAPDIVPLEQGCLEERALCLLESGHSRKDVLQVLSQETAVGRNEIYEMLIRLKKD